MMDDYVTRAEFEELKEMLLCRGDGQTVDVDHTPGGQMIRSISVTTAQEPETDSSPIDITYDSDNDYYTVTITSLQYIDTNGDTATEINCIKEVSSTLKFSGVSSVVGLSVVLFDNVASSATKVAWFDVSNASVYNSDASTLSAEIEVLNVGNFQQITFDGVGGYTLDMDENYPVVSYTPSECYRMKLTYLSGSIRLDNVILPSSITSTQLGGTGTTLTKSSSAPIDSKIIVGWNTNGSYTVDLYSNLGSYNDYHVIGHLKVDSSGVVRRAELYKAQLPIIGYTGSPSISGTTLTINNGLITNVT